MKSRFFCRRARALPIWLAATVLLGAHGVVIAGPGHDHGDGVSALAAIASTRFAAHSGLFELVGIVHEKRVALFLDEYTTNAPLLRGVIEIELQPAQGAAIKLKAMPAEGGAFDAPLARPLAAGSYAVTAIVRTEVAGQPEHDLLTATLEISAPAGFDSPAGAGQHAPVYAAIGLGVALAAILGAMAWRLRRNSRATGLRVQP